MTKATHTPGPWRVDDVLAGGHRKVRGPSGLVAVVGNGESNADTFAANARLIAAAPDLLDALKEANALILAPAEDIEESVLSRVRAAISKASTSIEEV